MMQVVIFLAQFMRPRSCGKKLFEEWAGPLKSVEDIYEVGFSIHSYFYVFFNSFVVYFLCFLLLTQSNAIITHLNVVLINRNSRYAALGS